MIASDPDGDGLTYEWTYTGSLYQLTESGIVNLAQNPTGPGTTRVTVTVSDGDSLSASAEVTLRITDTNYKPVCEPARYTIDENSAVSTAMSPSDAMTVTDRDTGDEHRWSIVGDNVDSTF